MSNNEEKNMAEVQEQKDDAMTAIEAPSTQEDIFADIFGQQEQIVATDPQQPNITSQNDTSNVPSTDDPKSDSDQFQYWQSQSDKKQVEIETLKGQMSEMMGALKSSAPTAEPVKETVKLEKPVKPSKPTEYDHSEALADPDSESAKYLSNREQYMDSMTDYMSTMEASRLDIMEEQQATQQKELSRQKLVNDLQGKYSYSNDEAKDFIETMSSPDSLSLDNLVQLHKMRTGNGPQEITQVTPQAQEKAALMGSRQEKLSIPKPIGVQPGASRQSSSKIEDQLMDSMVGDFKKRNPF
tara:strand:+ start:11664 stop:12554 length:891 start_codon:yes stop_codon:yes gene_type:complete